MRQLLSYACLVLPVLAATAKAQSASDAVYHLHGTVVNGVTGRPIGRALVMSGDRRLATMTNVEGQFALDVSVPAASASGQAPQATVPVQNGINAGTGAGPSVMLMARRPGYLRARQTTSVLLDANSATKDITLRLLPSASIRGQVTANGAESLHGLRVELLRHSVQDGRFTWRMAGTRQVSEDGSFRIADLEPGEYTLVTTEWSPALFRSMSAPVPAEEYQPIFLGGTRTLDGATKLHLSYGQTSQADLRVRAVPYYSVTIPVQGLPPNSGANVRVSTGAGFQLYELGWNNRDGAVEGALPDGNYQIMVSTFGAQRGGAQVPLHIAGAPVTHAAIGLTPTEDIPISVRDERTQGGSNNTGSVSLTLDNGSSTTVSTPGFFLNVRPVDPESGGGGVMQNSADGPLLRNMMPGSYYLQGTAMGRGYIAAVTCDGVNLLTEPLLVNESGHTAPIQVTLRDDGGTIRGTVDLGSSGVSAARVLLVPADGSGHVLYGYASGSGDFQIGNVPPGSYRAFAIPADQVDTLPYLDTQAMRSFNGRGGSVTVMAAQTAEVHADLVGLDGAEVQR